VTYRLGIVGGGNMGTALARGLVAAGWASPDELVVVEVLAARRDVLAEAEGLFGVAVVPSLEGVAIDAAVLAVKPGDVPDAARAAVAAGASRVLSIAAGVPLSVVEAATGGEVAVVRAMPNTAALVGAGAAAIAPGRGAADDDLAWAEGILVAVGTVVRVSETALDAVTGLSSSGPAYLFVVAEALIDAGVVVGLTRDVSRSLVQQLFVGSARLLADSGETPEALRAAVTSPAGTTAAGVHQLERAAVRAAFVDAVVAATERARELGNAITTR
jgi:pyrroline-5-carboxylate reductase